jgi:signal transduction histidine kinase
MDTSITNDGRVKETPAARGRSFGGVAAPAKTLAKDLPRSVAVRYGTAMLLVAVALSATLAVQRLFVFPYPFLFLFFGAVMASAWFGGMGAGLFSVLISTLAVDFFFVPPLYSWRVNATSETYFVAFVVCALVATWVSSAKKRSEEALREVRDQLEIRVSERTAALLQTQTELARLSRVLSMGELTASIAHEISQPLTAVVTNGQASLEWLSGSTPNLEKARQTTESIVRDGSRAGAVIDRVRALFRKEEPVKNWTDLNRVIQELTGFLRDEANLRRVSMRTQLSPALPHVMADRVQLQQVVMNLILNGMDAMSGYGEGDKERELVIRSQKESGDQVLIAVEDSGAGLDPETAERIFDPFFTTKPHGIGVGLSISRSIIESHRGCLWAEPRPSGGTIFQFTLPVGAKDSYA